MAYVFSPAAPRWVFPNDNSTGLEFLISEGWRSNCLTGLRLPKGVSYEKLHGELKANGFIIYAGQGNLSDNIFRIANMGNITQEEFERFLQVLKKTLTNS